MAYLVRLIIGALLACTMSLSFAAGVVPGSTAGFKVDGTAPSVPAGPYTGQTKADAASAFCAAYATAYGPTYAPNCYLTGDGRVHYVTTGWLVAYLSISADTSVTYCPANSTLGGGVCTCDSGYTPDGGSCVVYVDPDEAHCASIAGSPVKASWSTTNPSLSTSQTVCQGGTAFAACIVTVTADNCGQGQPGGPYVCHGSGAVSGGACTPSPAPSVPPAPGDPASDWPAAPPPGTCPGQMNGVDVNVPCSNTVSKQVKVTEENDGGGNTTNKSESKTTTCTAAGSCTTTTTTTTTVNGGSATTTSKTETQDKASFCAGNPGSKECGDGGGSSFGGSCNTAFTCVGDAVQCATAKAVNDSLCQFKNVFEMDEGTQALVQSVLDGTWTDNPRDNPEQISVGVFDQSNPLPSACPTDVTAQVAGFTLAIPLASMCPWLQIMGNMLVIVSLFGATIFIMRRGD